MQLWLLLSGEGDEVIQPGLTVITISGNGRMWSNACFCRHKSRQLEFGRNDYRAEDY